MGVAIVTDGAASLPTDLAAECGVAVVPMWLNLEGHEVRESDCSLDDVLRAENVTTSGPSPGEFEQAFTTMLGDDGVVVLTIAASMSSTYQAAALAAKELGDRVRVIDTTTAAGAEGLVVLAAARAARAGGDLDAVEAAARHAMSQVRLVATMPSLDHLVRSGRVPGIAGWAGRHLGINPLFEFRAGEVHALRPALSSDAAIERRSTCWTASGPNVSPSRPSSVSSAQSWSPTSGRA
jgi:DegV family protein with EDD domain